MVALANGCVCCSINNDLVEAIGRVLGDREFVDYVLVETTGIADPLPVALTFLRPEFRGRLRLDAIVSLVDAQNFRADLYDSQAARNQIRYADVILLNKCDLAQADRLDEVEADLRAIAEGARLLRTTQARAALPLILGTGLFDAGRGFAPEHDHDHRRRLRTLFLCRRPAIFARAVPGVSHGAARARLSRQGFSVARGQRGALCLSPRRSTLHAGSRCVDRIAAKPAGADRTESGRPAVASGIGGLHHAPRRGGDRLGRSATWPRPAPGGSP